MGTMLQRYDLALLGSDVVLYKNVLATLLPFVVVVGAGFAAAAAGRLGLGLAAALIALSRIWLGVHYVTDVLAGAALGAAVAYVAWRIVAIIGTRTSSP